MAKFFIRLGEFNKAMLLPFLLALAQLIRIILDDVLKEGKKNYILESSILGLGQVAVIIIPHIKFFSLSNKKEKNKCECSYKIILRYAILLFLYGIETNVMYVCYISQMISQMRRKDGNYKSKSMFRMKSEGLATKEGLEMVFITIIAIFLLKYKYFIHHILSIIFFLYHLRLLIFLMVILLIKYLKLIFLRIFFFLEVFLQKVDIFVLLNI